MEQATGEREVNVIGYCIGGTLIAGTLGYLAAKGTNGCRVPRSSPPWWTSRRSGEISVFIDDEQIHLLDQHMESKGVLDGQYMATVFNMLRANDLIWSNVVNNYLLGQGARGRSTCSTGTPTRPGCPG